MKVLTSAELRALGINVLAEYSNIMTNGQLNGGQRFRRALLTPSGKDEKCSNGSFPIESLLLTDISYT